MNVEPINQNQKNLAIGVFDSGMGGLTVLKELKKSLPNESLIYLGDTARLPYGTKSLKTVRQYALQMARILIEQDIKLLVIACNTATTAALDYLRQQFPNLSIIGVVEPGAATAVNTTRCNKVAVLATETTIRSNIYELEMQKLNADLTTINLACGLFVALAEEGCVDDAIAIAAIEKYLAPLKQSEIDCLVLGCTHFTVLKQAIQNYLGNGVEIVDSAEATARAVAIYLEKNNLMAVRREFIRFFVTDQPERFIRISSIFFSEEVDPKQVELIEFTNETVTRLQQTSTVIKL